MTLNTLCGYIRAVVLPPCLQQGCLQPHALHCSQQGTAFATQPVFKMCFPLRSAIAVLCSHTHKHCSAPGCVTTLPKKFPPLRPQHWASWSRDAGSPNSIGTIWGGKCTLAASAATVWWASPAQPYPHSQTGTMHFDPWVSLTSDPRLTRASFISHTFFFSLTSNTNGDKCALGSKFLGAFFPTPMVESMQLLAPCPIFPKTARPLVSYCLSFSPKAFQNK